MTRSRDLRRDIVGALSEGGTAQSTTLSQRELFGAAAGILPPAFARSWATQARSYRRHIADLSSGDQSALQPAIKVKHKLYRMTNSGEISRETAELLHDHIEGRGDGALPRIGQAEEAGREARRAGYAKAIRGLRAEDETLDPRSILGELRILRGR
jgi:hypothetical protein